MLVLKRPFSARRSAPGFRLGSSWLTVSVTAVRSPSGRPNGMAVKPRGSVVIGVTRAAGLVRAEKLADGTFPLINPGVPNEAVVRCGAVELPCAKPDQ